MGAARRAKVPCRSRGFKGNVPQPFEGGPSSRSFLLMDLSSLTRHEEGSGPGHEYAPKSPGAVHRKKVHPRHAMFICLRPTDRRGPMIHDPIVLN
jgi:hypothetical protein